MTTNSVASLEKLRNIGIIAHIDAGKTTLTERMLFYTRKIHRMGEVHEGTATMDYMPEEQERGITITSACTTCTWNAHTINIIDTPGHVDFTIEVERSLRVLDGAVGVFCAVGGVEPQSETVWRQSEQFHVPKVAFINKIDRIGADFVTVLKSMESRLHIRAVPVNIPLGQGEDFCALLDLVNEERIDFDAQDQGSTVHRQAFSTEEALLAAPWREALLEHIAEVDEEFFEAYVTDSTLSPDNIWTALRRATMERRLTPVLCGSALRNVGIQPLMDAVCTLLPSPAHVSPTAWDKDGTAHNITPHAAEPVVALVFKVLMESGRKTAFVRIYAGTLQQGHMYTNCSQQREDRVQRMYRLHADHREPLEKAEAGDIVAVVGLQCAHTGETYTEKTRPLLLEAIKTYEPVITLALEPRNADEGKTLDEALERYTAEDPTLRVAFDEGSGHRMLSGMGELHIDVILERMQREYAINPRVGHPQVVQRQTIAHAADAEAEFDRELGKEYHYGKVTLHIEPLPRGNGNEICFGDAIPPLALTDAREASKLGLHSTWLAAVQQGISDTLQCDPLTGYPVQDVRVCITALEKKETISSAPGYHMAAGMALREALALGSPLTLEPLMRLEITVPEEYLGAAITLCNTCGGRVDNLLDRGGQKVLQGLAPLSRLFGFSTALRSATQGRAGLMMQFERFDTI